MNKIKPDNKYSAWILNYEKRLLFIYLDVPGLIVRLINSPTIISTSTQKNIGLLIS